MLSPTLLLLLSTWASAAEGAASARWHGDVPRAALEALPSPRQAEAEGAGYLIGCIAGEEAWGRFQEAVAASRWAEAWRTQGWPPEIDWSRQSVVYAAFDGATRMLVPESWSAEGPRATLAIGQQFSRRPDAPDGPCSVVVQVVGSGVEEVELRLGESTLGTVELAPE